MEQIVLENIQNQLKADTNMRRKKPSAMNTILFLGEEVRMICHVCRAIFLKKSFWGKLASIANLGLEERW